jgi:hypothetical protein
MPVYRMQVAVTKDTSEVRDRIVLTPHFDDKGIASNPENLCGDLADALTNWSGQLATTQVDVKAYDARGTIPNYPKAHVTRRPGQVSVSNAPRELAVCLSFYAEHNRPRSRGRLYIPHGWLGTNANVKVDLSSRQKVADLVSIFAGLGGADVDWVVWSRRDNEAKKVTDWWVDNEYDVQRSRGLRPDARLKGTTSG